MSKNTRLINTLIGVCVIVFIIVTDQITKQLVMANMQLGQSIDLIPGVLRFTYITNSGSAFGMLSNARWVFMVLSVVGISAIGVYTVMYADKLGRPVVIMLSAICGGGLGNMVDRLFYGETFGNGKVVDFIDFCAFPNLWKWIFNFADACVTVSCGALVVLLIVQEVKRLKRESKTRRQTVAEGEMISADREGAPGESAQGGESAEQPGQDKAGESADADADTGADTGE